MNARGKEKNEMMGEVKSCGEVVVGGGGSTCMQAFVTLAAEWGDYEKPSHMGT